MKTGGGMEVQLHVFLTSTLGGCEWSASRPCRSIRGKRPGDPFDRRLGGPQNRSGCRGYY